MRRGTKLSSPRRFWSKADLSRLRKLYSDHPSNEIAKSLNRSLASVYNTAYALGLKKSEQFIQSEESRCRLPKGQTRCGVKTQFKKGAVPFNKGLRRPGWHAGRMKETQFKKGQRQGMAARNWVPIGTIKPDSEGYLRIKIREAKHGQEATGFGNSQVWPLYNRYLWEQHKGPIPPKHIVVFKDGKRDNCVIENLELISMKENARRNQMWNRLPPDLIQVIQLNGVLKRTLRRLNGKEQDGRSSESPVRDD